MSPFELLGETPRPWLDPDTLKTKFLKLSAPLHPDRVHHLTAEEKENATRRFAEINAAYLQIREPRERINLLLEAVTGSKPKDIQKIPPGTMDLFVEVGQFCRDLDSWLAARNPAESSPLLKVASMKQLKEWQERHRVLDAKVQAKAARTSEELKSLDSEWLSTSDHKPLLERMENLGRQLSYVARWSQQLEERSLQLQVS